MKKKIPVKLKKKKKTHWFIFQLCERLHKNSCSSASLPFSVSWSRKTCGRQASTPATNTLRRRIQWDWLTHCGNTCVLCECVWNLTAKKTKTFLNSSLFRIKVKPQQTPEPTLEQKLLEWIYFGHSNKLYRAQGCVCVCVRVCVFVISADSSTAPFHRFNETNLPKNGKSGLTEAQKTLSVLHGEDEGSL